MKNLEIAPSILTADFGNIYKEIACLQENGISWLHLDIMDGHFVPNISFGPKIVQDIKKHHENMFLDSHLMVSNPENYIEKFAEAGSDLITVHAEAAIHLHRLIQSIKKIGIKVGVSLNPATPPENIKYILNDIDLVLVMSVNPGFGGQKFITSSLEKISTLAAWRQKEKYSYSIQVDGGINDKTAKSVIEAGADILVVGSYIFDSSNYGNAIANLKQNCIL